MPLKDFRKPNRQGESEEDFKLHRAFHMVNRSFVRLQRGNAVGALADATEAIEQGDTRPVVYWRKAMALESLGSFAEAQARRRPYSTPSPVRTDALSTTTH